ncbi:MAG: hypothetical protein R3222_05260 [Balneolaceae bacterium]|nr:hypothetical protein [Balneolaceae bacterium]
MKTLKNITAILFSVLLLFAVVSNAFGQQQASLEELINKATQAGLNEQVVNTLVERAENSNFSQAELSQIIQSAISMAEENLPAEAALSKALEGISKGASPAQVTSLVGSIQSSSKQASGIVEPWFNNNQAAQKLASEARGMSEEKFRQQVIVEMARGLRENVSPETYASLLSEMTADESLAEQLYPAQVVAAVSMIPELPAEAAQQGKIARGFVLRILKSGLHPSEMRKLPMALAQGQMRGDLPAEAMMASVVDRLGSGIPASQVLQKLMNGNLGAGPQGSLPIGIRDNISIPVQ